MSWLSTMYLGCFAFGLIFTVATFLLGGVGHIGHLGHAGHSGGTHSPTGHASSHSATSHSAANSAASHDHTNSPSHLHSFQILNYLNLSALVVFVTWFGAAGFVSSALGFDGVFSLLPAFVLGLAGYAAVLLLLLKVLLPASSAPRSAADDNLDGMVARVSSPIFGQGVGEVIYLKDGVRRFAPARSHDGKTFSKDSKVVILKYEGGTAFVADLDKLLADAGAEQWVIPTPEEQRQNQ